MKLSVLANLYGAKPLDEALSILSGLGVHTIEIGGGGYPGKAHCDPEVLLADEKKLEEFKALLKKYDVEISALSQKELISYRRHDVGFVFQFYNLIGNLTALENVELARQVCPNALDPAEVLRQVGLGERMGNFPAQLSGGEQQRVAIARALAKNPKLLLCDEPTGALDYQTGKAILQLLQDTGRRTGMTVIIITHNGALTAMADRVIRVKNGTVSSVEINEHPQDIAEIEW